MDVVERLTNKPEPCRRYSAEDDALRSEAAATITALRARVEELEGAADAEREWLKKQVFALSEDTIEKYHGVGQRDTEGKEGAFARGRCTEAKSIARAISDVCHERAALRAKGGDDPHSDDLAVDRFAAAMKAKLAQKRAEGRGGWDDKDACSGEWLSRLLRGHVEKGDPVDVANFAMMLHQRGERIAP